MALDAPRIGLRMALIGILWMGDLTRHYINIEISERIGFNYTYINLITHSKFLGVANH